jgi:hypothetical protein
MTRQLIRGLVLLTLLTVVATSARAQNTPDTVTIRERKDNTTKAFQGTYTVSPAGFQVIAADKKVLATFNPDDVVKVAIGELAGVERNGILGLMGKEDNAKKDWAEIRAGYQDLLKKSAGAPERSKRYLEYKAIASYNKLVDEMDPTEEKKDTKDKGVWKDKAEDVVKTWTSFLAEPANRAGWEVWPAVRSCTRVQIELGKYDEAARTWGKITTNKDLPPESRLEAQLQEIDLQIRGKLSANAVLAAGELQKTATGARKERLAIYEIAAKAGNDPKLASDAVTQIKAEMDKTKDPSVHATGYSMQGVLYQTAGKPREAMWAFLWVETVLNHDRDEAFKAVSQLATLFAKDLMDEDQARKYHDKMKRFRSTF